MSPARRRALVSLVLALGVGAFGCTKRDEPLPKQQPSAGLQAEHETSETTITSGQLDEPLNAEERAAQVEDDRLKNQALAIGALRREQLDYRSRVQTELDAIEQRLADARATRDDVRVKRLVDRRAALASDIASIDRSTGDDWAPLRGRIDRDLAPIFDVTPIEPKVP